MLEAESQWEGWFKAPMPFGRTDFKLVLLEVKTWIFFYFIENIPEKLGDREIK